MSRSIRDLIDEKLRDFNWESDEEPIKLKLDTYSYATLMEELGHNPEIPFTHYRGMYIKVDENMEDLCEIL
jgi:hypothetical protein